MVKLSKWLKRNLKNNVKETLEATIEHLLKLKPPVKKNKRQALMSSLQDLTKNDEAVRKEYEPLNAWFNVNNSEKERNLKIVDKEHQARFKKARIVQYNVSYRSNSEINSLNGQKVKEEKEDNLSSRIPHKFLFSASKQGSYVEPILEHIEKALFRFVVKNRDYISFDTVKEFALKCNPSRNIDFSDADILCLLNFITKYISLFIIPHSDKTLFYGKYKLKPLSALQSFKTEARNHHVHGITKSEGKWNDEKLQRLSTLILFIHSELVEQYALPMKKKHENNENEFQERKRHMTDEELRELTDFALNIVNKLESENKEHLNQIVRLAVDKNEAFINIWRTLVTSKDE
ncbi:4151_t:CDS:2, partial [Funneliformis geosporum]